MAAGTFKFRNDEYFLKHGDPLYDPDWPAKEYEKMRNTAPKPFPVPRPETQQLMANSSLRLPSSRRSESSSRVGRPTPARQPVPSSPSVVRKVRGGTPKGGRDWGWCLPKPVYEQAFPAAGPPPANGSVDSFQMTKSLSSPSTLTALGSQERVRVLGANWAPSITDGTYRPASRSATLERLDTPDDKKFKLPQTDNQKYGSRLAEAQPLAKFHPKSTCDVCVFSDSAAKTMTPYNANIRF